VDEQNAPVRAAGFIKTWVSHRLIGGLRFDRGLPDTMNE
jgi:hypothetical protein